MSEKPQPPETQEFSHEGGTYVGHRIEIVGRSEPPVTYSLEDGAVFSIRTNAVGIYRLEGITQANGDPVYKTQLQIQSHVWARKATKEQEP